MGLGSEIRDPEKPIPDPGSKRHRIPDPDPQHWDFVVKLCYRFFRRPAPATTSGKEARITWQLRTEKSFRGCASSAPRGRLPSSRWDGVHVSKRLLIKMLKFALKICDIILVLNFYTSIFTVKVVVLLMRTRNKKLTMSLELLFLSAIQIRSYCDIG